MKGAPNLSLSMYSVSIFNCEVWLVTDPVRRALLAHKNITLVCVLLIKLKEIDVNHCHCLTDYD